MAHTERECLLRFFTATCMGNGAFLTALALTACGGAGNARSDHPSSSDGRDGSEAFGREETPAPTNEASRKDPEPPRPREPARPAFPKSVAGFQFGSDFLEAASACPSLRETRGGNFICASPAVRLPFADEYVLVAFQVNRVETVLVPVRWRVDTIRALLIEKYGPPDEDVDLADVEGLSEQPAEGARTVTWRLRGGRVTLFVAQRGLSVIYKSTAGETVERQNY